MSQYRMGRIEQRAANRNSCARLYCAKGLWTLYPSIKPMTLRAHLKQAYGLRHNGAVNGFLYRGAVLV